MNEIVHKFLLARDKFMHKMHLRQPGFIWSDCGLFAKNKERTQRNNRFYNIFIKTN